MMSRSMRPASRRRLLLLLAAVLVVASAVPTSQGRDLGVSRSEARPPVSSGRNGRDNAEDEDEDENEDDDDAWGFVLDAAPAVHTQAAARPCAESLPAALLDDDYCDCEADGSDEPNTSACSHVVDGGSSFACHAGDQRVPLGFVADDVCDCCDGSDELPARCPNACAVYYQSARDRLAERLATIERGLAVRDEYVRQAASAVARLQHDFQLALAVYRQLHDELQRTHEALMAGGAPPSPEQMEDFERVRYELMWWQNRAFVAQRVASSGTFGEDASGPGLSNWKRAFAPLVGQCFGATVDEKQLKGGTPNVVPRTYEFRLCPFQNISQHEPTYPEWTRVERRRKHAEAALDDNADDEVKAPMPTMLGVWDAWMGDSLVDHERRPVRQRFDHGEVCAATNRERVTFVDVACGDDNRVEAVEEPEMCVYHVQFVTPAACDPDQRDAVWLELARAQELVGEFERESASGSHATRSAAARDEL